ncbi:hypothetical protein PMIN03_001453 [Paraphaeosphaeria minitans]
MYMLHHGSITASQTTALERIGPVMMVMTKQVVERHDLDEVRAESEARLEMDAVKTHVVEGEEEGRKKIAGEDLHAVGGKEFAHRHARKHYYIWTTIITSAAFVRDGLGKGIEPRLQLLRLFSLQNCVRPR